MWTWVVLYLGTSPCQAPGSLAETVPFRVVETVRLPRASPARNRDPSPSKGTTKRTRFAASHGFRGGHQRQGQKLMEGKSGSVWHPRPGRWVRVEGCNARRAVGGLAARPSSVCRFSLLWKSFDFVFGFASAGPARPVRPAPRSRTRYPLGAVKTLSMEAFRCCLPPWVDNRLLRELATRRRWQSHFSRKP